MNMNMNEISDYVVDNKCFWFGYLLEGFDTPILCNNKFVLTYDNEIINAQFISSLWFLQHFNLNQNVKFYILKTDSNLNYETVQKLFFSYINYNVTDTIELYTFYINKNLLNYAYDNLKDITEIQYNNNFNSNVFYNIKVVSQENSNLFLNMYGCLTDDIVNNFHNEDFSKKIVIRNPFFTIKR